MPCPRPAGGVPARSTNARPATSATASPNRAGPWSSASSAGASSTAPCARPSTGASPLSAATSCSTSSPTISSAFPSSSPPELGLRPANTLQATPKSPTADHNPQIEPQTQSKTVLQQTARAVPGRSAHLGDVLQMRFQRGQQLGCEGAHARILAGLGIALEQLDGLDVRFVLGLDVGLVEVVTLLVGKLPQRRLVLGVELVRRHGELGLQHGFLELHGGSGVVVDHALGEGLHRRGLA